MILQTVRHVVVAMEWELLNDLVGSDLVGGMKVGIFIKSRDKRTPNEDAVIKKVVSTMGIDGNAEYGNQNKESFAKFDGILVDKNGILIFDRQNSIKQMSVFSYEDIVSQRAEIVKIEKDIREIDAREVGNIHLFFDEIQNPERFWSQKYKYDEKKGEKRRCCKEDFIKCAFNLKEVRERLTLGESLENIAKDIKLKDTVQAYFYNMIKCIENKDIVELAGDGRHRIIAAAEINEKIPILVDRKYQLVTADKINAKEKGFEDKLDASIRFN